MSYIVLIGYCFIFLVSFTDLCIGSCYSARQLSDFRLFRERILSKVFLSSDIASVSYV